MLIAGRIVFWLALVHSCLFASVGFPVGFDRMTFAAEPYKGGAVSSSPSSSPTSSPSSGSVRGSSSKAAKNEDARKKADPLSDFYGKQVVGGKKILVVERVSFANLTNARSSGKNTVFLVISALVKKNIRNVDKLVVPIDLEYKKDNGGVGLYSVVLVFANQKKKLDSMVALHSSSSSARVNGALVRYVANQMRLEKFRSVVTHEQKQGNDAAAAFNIRMVLRGVPYGDIGLEYKKRGYK